MVLWKDAAGMDSDMAETLKGLGEASVRAPKGAPISQKALLGLEEAERPVVRLSLMLLSSSKDRATPWEEEIAKSGG